MTTVSAVNGLAYGFKVMAVFGVVLTVAAVLTAVGTNMIATARTVSYLGGVATDWPRLIAGAVLSLTGGLTLYAGSMGLLYKVIADGVRRGNSRTA
ncbi:hypothetical protein [Halosimplex salinum]|uniref:hypothetical protein n=1 Tax=Halosimplex salinum TaxID=1710538 RepID=UPI000F4A5DFB|nr:hypothetical protein [Halosimplex salinum]